MKPRIDSHAIWPAACAALTATLLLTAAQPATAQPGRVLSHQKISENEGGFTGNLNDDDFFGLSVGSLGDLDGDGVGDLAVGAPFDDDGGTNVGAVWVLFLDSVPAHPLGDLNCDGAFNGADIDPFFLVLGDTVRYIAKFPNCDFMLVDMNQDGFVNGADIDPFFACLSGNCP